MQNEDVLFEKIAEIEAQQKTLDKEQADMEERKKDIDQEKKIIELQENQTQKYQEEISRNKEALRQLKIESQKELLEQEDSSAALGELKELMFEKETVKEEIEEIKIKKNKLLDRAEETIKSAKEMKSVIATHNENKVQIKDLKSEVCLSLEKINKIKVNIDDLRLKNKTLEKENKKLSTDLLTPNKELESKISDLVSQKNKILEDNLKIKNQKSLLIKIETSKNGDCSLEMPSSLGGVHKYKRQRGFDKGKINELIGVSFEIDEESKLNSEKSIKEIFESKRKKLINAHLDNREYKKQNISYEYIA